MIKNSKVRPLSLFEHSDLDRYGSLYDTIAILPSNRLAPLMVILYMMRRLILALNVLFLSKYPCLQIAIMIYTSIFILGY